jgi:hypothetical protein
MILAIMSHNFFLPSLFRNDQNCIMRECEDIRDLVFGHQDGISVFDFTNRFLEISCSDLLQLISKIWIIYNTWALSKDNQIRKWARFSRFSGYYM